jgi:Ni/Fe-hydrogenase subunit HybB-like protein
MSGHAHTLRRAVLAKLERPLPVHVRPLLALAALAGAAAFVALALGADPARAWRAYHVNWLFWTGLSQAGIIFACSQVIVGAKWSRPIRRMAEASAAFLPISLVLFLVLWLGRADLFPWVRHPVLEPPVKAFWLRDGFLFGRDIAGLLLLYGLSLWFVYHSLRLDRADLGDAEVARSEDRLRRLAPGIVFAYAVVMSLLAFDLIMSLAPQWVSNLLGAFFFAGAWLTGLMALALLAIQWRRHLGIEDLVTPKTLHDLGKLCFGFSVFWAYLFFSQFLVIWYGNMPEETSFLFLRMARPEWRGISTAMVLLVFFVPFWGLLGAKPKKTPAILGTFAAISLCGVWVDRYVLTVPSLVQQAPALPLGWQEGLVTLGFLGVWGLAYTWFARRYPIVSPYLMDRMEAEGTGGH